MANITESTYPVSYRGIKLKWQSNEPKYKNGDKVLIYRDDKYQYITLDKVTKEPMHVRWLKACWGCRKPNPMTCDKFVYRWNNELFTEGEEIDPVDSLNRQTKRIKEYQKEIAELSTKAKLFDQLQSTLRGELVDRDEW
jgi:hypothetical protein